jgi:hypothetical protein
MSNKNKIILTISILAIISVVTVLIWIYSGENKTQPNTSKENTEVNPDGNSKVEIKTYQTDVLLTRDDGKTDRGWGYDIYMNGELYIHQPYIPAINGKFSFKSEVRARKVALLAVIKIQNKIMPPAITAKELDSLGVLK